MCEVNTPGEDVLSQTVEKNPDINFVLCVLECFIFSPFLNFKMPGVPKGSISGKKFYTSTFSIMTSY